MNLSLPATALFTELRDTGEKYPRDAFEREFPGNDYDTALSEALEEMKNAGLSAGPGQAFKYEGTRGVIFTVKTMQVIDLRQGYTK
ncbi:hypothetical protein ACIPSE_36940 [Streptomyces sp. NPDC090106]|uniref:hypothetical protein n=1 Tax=Streptomyces sp. NPDC090106 TaxID=3365946 RepID=UPI003822027E